MSPSISKENEDILMTSPKRKRNISSYDAAVRALAGMNQDMVNLRNFIQPPNLECLLPSGPNA